MVGVCRYPFIHSQRRDTVDLAEKGSEQPGVAGACCYLLIQARELGQQQRRCRKQEWVRVLIGHLIGNRQHIALINELGILSAIVNAQKTFYFRARARARIELNTIIFIAVRRLNGREFLRSRLSGPVHHPTPLVV